MARVASLAQEALRTRLAERVASRYGLRWLTTGDTILT